MNKRMTIRDIAGFCPEIAIWKMMADVSALLSRGDVKYNISPDSVVIDGDMFVIEDGTTVLNDFVAPEGIKGEKPDMKQMVWSLGSVAYFAATGHIIFGGHGSSYQKENPSVPLPVLPKGLQALTTVLHKCICYNPEERVSMLEVNELAQKGLASCKKQQRVISDVIKKEKEKEVKSIGEKWPEKMVEI